MEMTSSISKSELESVRTHTAGRLPRVLDEPPNPLNAVVVFRKESSNSAKTDRGVIKSATTKKTTDVAPPYYSPNFPLTSQSHSCDLQHRTTLTPTTLPLLQSLSSSSSSPPPPPSPPLPPPSPPLPPPSPPPQLLLSKPPSQYYQLRPHRRLTRTNPCVLDTSFAKTVPTVPKLQRTRRKTTNNSPSCYKKEKIKYSPPLSMVTQGFYSTPSPTTSWVAQQSQRLGGIRAGSFKYEKVTLSSNTAQASASRISSKSLFTDKVPLPMSLDTDSCRSDPITARPAKNLDGAAPNKTLEHNDETNSDESDMYLMAAKEEGLHRQLSMKSSVTPTRNRQSRIRHDSLPSNAKLDSIIPLRHGPDCEQIAANLDSSNKLELYGQTGNETVNMDQINYGNIYNGYKRSSSVMSRDQNLKLYSPDQHSSSIGRRLLVSCALQQASSSGGGGGGGGRRSSVPDAALFSRPGNRQLKSLSTPHTYYSSPLVPRTTEAQETSEVGRQLEDTESTNSTTVQSTVWDELDDLKSRIHRLESVGKLPPNVGTENFRISNDRPLTATTTVTTMSTSPRRERANSKSSIDQNLRIPVGDTSYILKSALIKSKPFLDSDIYRVLELTASDAISLSSMLGNLGQSSSITHANASPYSPTIISDRQVRRKAESMCRSLTELCLALSEKNSRNEKTSLNVASRDINNQSTLESPNLPPSRLSPRPLSQLEVRRSNLLAPKVDHTLKPLTDLESSNTNQLSGRRTSLFFRSGRGKFEGSSEENEDRTRAPSRIFSEVHSNRKSYPREKIYPFNLSEKTPPIMSESTLPMRRHNSSASYSTSPVPTLSSFSRWRKSDQNQTERNRVTSSVVGRVIEDQEHNDSSFIESPTLESSHSLTRRTRHLSPNDITSAGQRIGFH